MREVIASYVMPDHPKYSLEVGSDGALRVISRFKVDEGKPLAPGWFYPDDGWSFKLYNEDGYNVYFARGLNGLAARFKLKELRNEMNYTKTSLSGPVQTGDFIVGSINKATGAFSTSSSPARHTGILAAKQEAARLAAIDKSKKFIVLKAEAIANVQDVSWE